MKLFAPLEDLKLLISTSDEDRLSALDGVRALALLWVFALHSAQIPMWVPPSSMKISEVYIELKQQWWFQSTIQGGTGVDVFFVLSGLLISSGYQRIKDPSFFKRYGSFLSRRFFRIWPMVFAAVMTSVLMGLCISSYSLKNAERVWAYLLLVPNFVPQSLKKSDISQLWSVGVEMQMYLITPFVVDLLVSRETGKRRSWAFLGLAMISACCVAFRVYLVYGPPQNSMVDTWPPPPLYVNPLARLSPYASGIAVHFALSDCQEGQSGGTWRRLCSFVVDVLPVSVLALSFFIGSKVLKPPFFTTNIFSPLANELMVITWPPLYGWCLARAIFRAITAPKGKDLSEWFNFWCWFRAFLSSRIWTPLAILSYGAYVLQFIIGRWALPYFLDAVNLSFSGLTRDDVLPALWRYAVVFLLFTLIGYALALPYHLFVEKPGMRLGKVLSDVISKSRRAVEAVEEGKVHSSKGQISKGQMEADLEVAGA